MSTLPLVAVNNNEAGPSMTISLPMTDHFPSFGGGGVL